MGLPTDCCHTLFCYLDSLWVFTQTVFTLCSAMWIVCRCSHRLLSHFVLLCGLYVGVPTDSCHTLISCVVAMCSSYKHMFYRLQASIDAAVMQTEDNFQLLFICAILAYILHSHYLLC